MSERLMDIAKGILAEYVMRDIEFSEVYEDESAEDLTEDEQRIVHGYMQGAEYTIKMPPLKGDER